MALTISQVSKYCWGGCLNGKKELDDDVTQFWGEENEIGYVRAHIPDIVLYSISQSQVKDAHDAHITHRAQGDHH